MSHNWKIQKIQLIDAMHNQSIQKIQLIDAMHNQSHTSERQK